MDSRQLHSHQLDSNLTSILRSFKFVILAVVCSALLSSCLFNSEAREFERAEAAQAAEKFEAALKHYDQIIRNYVKTPLAIKSAKTAARISAHHLKNLDAAAAYYKHVVVYASNATDRVEAQRNLAELHFTQTLDYKKAVTEYSRLLELPHTPKQEVQYRFALARSYFYLNNFFQAQTEIDTLVARVTDPELQFDALLLKANILLTTKNLDDAIETLKTIIEKFPERSRKETVGLILAVCYEEQKKFALAVDTLKSIRDWYPRKEFIDQKIRTLKERQTYLPGAKGWTK